VGSKPRSKTALQQDMAISLTKQRLKTEMVRSSLTSALLDPDQSADKLRYYVLRALRDMEDDD
jgi:hypothetical protein